MGNPDTMPGLELPDQDVGLFDIEREIREPLEFLASNSSDPDGAIQNYDTAMIYSSYFGMDMERARKMAELGVASSVTGVDYEGKNYGQALKTTGQHALWQEGKGLATSAYQFTGDPKFLRIAEDYENKIRKNPVTKEYGAIGDLVLDSVQPAMSTLKFLGTTALLSWIPGGIAAKTGWKTLSTLAKAGTSLARGVNFLSAGYSQAGNVLYEVMQTEDANGNKLPWDTLSGGLLYHGFAFLTGAVEMASFERLPFFKAIDRAFTKGELVKHLERGAVNAIKNYSFETGKSVVSESLEEGAQSILQNVYENILMAAANKEGADFDIHSIPDIAKDAVTQTVEAAKSMILTSMISGGMGQGVYTLQHRKLSAESGVHLH